MSDTLALRNRRLEEEMLKRLVLEPRVAHSAIKHIRLAWRLGVIGVAGVMSTYILISIGLDLSSKAYFVLGTLQLSFVALAFVALWSAGGLLAEKFYVDRWQSLDARLESDEAVAESQALINKGVILRRFVEQASAAGKTSDQMLSVIRYWLEHFAGNETRMHELRQRLEFDMEKFVEEMERERTSMESWANDDVGEKKRA